MCLSLLEFTGTTCFRVHVVEIGRFFETGKDAGHSCAVDANVLGNVLTRLPLLVPGNNASDFGRRSVNHIGRLWNKAVGAM